MNYSESHSFVIASTGTAHLSHTFVEQIDVSVSIFLSEKDALVPADRVEAYLRTKDVAVENFDDVTEDHFRHQINCTVFRGDGHGDWAERPSMTVPMIVRGAEGKEAVTDE
jgi:hypothetical protein